MRVRSANWLVLGLALLAAGCGGGGGTSSGAGGAYAGHYVGTATYTISGAGGTVSDSGPAVVVVEPSGQVYFVNYSTIDSGVSCSGSEPVYLSGNSVSYTDTYTCYFPGVGTCVITETGTGRIEGNTATGTVSGTITCPGGTLTVTLTFQGTRQASAAARAAGTSGRLSEHVRRLFDAAN